MYRADHIKVLKALAGNLPRRQELKTKDIVGKVFRRTESGDRRVRNAYRKLVKEGLIETVDRGVYRLTVSGAAYCRQLEKSKWRIPKQTKPVIKKKVKKGRKTKKAKSATRTKPVCKEMSATGVFSF